MNSCIFTNDNNVSIKLCRHYNSKTFSKRVNKEMMFRKINTFLINKNIIKNNIIDLGAWIGDNSIPWAKNINGIVYAIDPSPQNCDFVKRICKLNEINNVKILEYAISNENKIVSTNSDLQHCSFVWGKLEGENKYNLNAVSLDYLFEKKEIDNIGYMHLDVEGMEYEVLEGSINIINTCRPIITFEQHLEIEDYGKILTYLKNLKYNVFLIDEISGKYSDCRNSIAFPNEIFNNELINDIHEYLGKKLLIEK